MSSRAASRLSTSVRHTPPHIYSTVVRLIVHRLHYDFTAPHSVSSQYDSYGTGFFIDGDGHILTCAHVIDDANDVMVEIPAEGRRRFTATILGICPEFDIGLLRINEHQNRQWCKIDANNQLGVRPGNQVSVVGYPLGSSFSNLKQTQGVISGQQLNRYQTDAPINPGNSGGPVFKKGTVIGIADSVINGSNIENIGFAIPIVRYVSLAHLLKHPKRIVHFPSSWGITFQHTYPDWVEFTGCRCGPKSSRRHAAGERRRSRSRTAASGSRRSFSSAGGGVYITQSVRDGLLWTAGVRQGDVLCKVDEMPLDAFGELPQQWMNQQMTLANLLATLPLGKRVPIEYWSHTKRKLIRTSVLLRERPLPVRTVYPSFEHVEYDIYGGMVVMPLTHNHVRLFWGERSRYTPPHLAKYLQRDNCRRPKLVVASVLASSYLSFLDILSPEPHVIKTVNRRPAATIEAFRAATQHPIRKHNRSYMELCTENDIKIVIPTDSIQKESTKLKAIHKYT